MKRILVISVIIVSVFYIMWVGFLWKIPKSRFSGSYPNAETWSFKINEADLKKVIEEIKKENPELEPPNAGYPTSGQNSYWYNFIFYYDDTKENVYTWIRSNEDSAYTTLAFVGIASHIDSLTVVKDFKMYQKDINKDFGYFSNRSQIKKFENRILKLIELKVGEREN
jgi:hypothetical protein